MKIKDKLSEAVRRTQEIREAAKKAAQEQREKVEKERQGQG